jgi:sec-independent protein translocase protein TatB
MFDIGWSELLVIGVVALVVIGPKDLPRVLKTVGYWVRKARNVSREFQSSIEQMVREAELEDVKKEIEKVSSLDLHKEIERTVDPTGDLKKSLEPPVLPSLDPVPASADAALPPGPEPAPAPAEPAQAPAEPVSAADQVPPAQLPVDAAPTPAPQHAAGMPETTKTAASG